MIIFLPDARKRVTDRIAPVKMKRLCFASADSLMFKLNTIKTTIAERATAANNVMVGMYTHFIGLSIIQPSIFCNSINERQRSEKLNLSTLNSQKNLANPKIIILMRLKAIFCFSRYISKIFEISKNILYKSFRSFS